MPKPNPIELIISREDFHPLCTQSRMLANGNLFCFVLEDTDRGLDSSMLGCPLVGEHVFNDRTQNTTEARKRLDDLILTQISNGGDVYITITRKEGYQLAVAPTA